MVRQGAETARKAVSMRVWLGFLALATLALAACSGDGSGGGEREGMRIVFVSHGHASDAFWSVVANGVRDAAADLGVRVDYQAPASFDIQEMRRLVEAAVGSRPSGLVVTIPDAGVLGATLRAATAAGVPVLSMNAGDDAWESLGLLGHIGQTEYEAGFAGGERLARAGARHALCVNHEVGNASLEVRCRGLDDAMRRAGGRTTVIGIDLGDGAAAEQRLTSALAANGEIDAVLALGPGGAVRTAAALRSMDRLGRMLFGTFDLEPEVLRGVRDGAILFAIDQQPYMQGYLAVTLMVKYVETGAIPGGGQLIRTGPAFVTRETAESVIRLTEEGRR